MVDNETKFDVYVAWNCVTHFIGKFTLHTINNVYEKKIKNVNYDSKTVFLDAEKLGFLVM